MADGIRRPEVGGELRVIVGADGEKGRKSHGVESLGHDQYGADRPVHAMGAHRSDDETGESAQATAADDEHSGLLCRADEHVCRVTECSEVGDLDAGLREGERLQLLLELVADGFGDLSV